MKNKLFLFAVLPLAFLMILSTGCKKEPCEDVVCPANSSCVEGVCICDDGYMGTDCADEVRGGFIGNFNVTEQENNNPNSSTYTARIDAVSGEVFKVTIYNLAKLQSQVGAPDTDVIAVDVIDATTAKINQQVVYQDYTWEGDINIDGDTIRLQYNVSSVMDAFSSDFTTKFYQ